MRDDLDLDALEAAALAATPQDFDSAEIVQKSGGEIECPACGGEGYVTLDVDYCNYDSKALGVQFYGIGTEHGAAEDYYRTANPATIINLIHRLRTAEAAVAQGQADLLVLSAALAEARDNDRAAMGWLVDARMASGDDGKRMLPEFVEYLKGLKADAERYQWLINAPATWTPDPVRHWLWSRPCDASRLTITIDDAISEAKKLGGAAPTEISF